MPKPVSFTNFDYDSSSGEEEVAPKQQQGQAKKSSEQKAKQRSDKEELRNLAFGGGGGSKKKSKGKGVKSLADVAGPVASPQTPGAAVPALGPLEGSIPANSVAAAAAAQRLDATRMHQYEVDLEAALRESLRLTSLTAATTAEEDKGKAKKGKQVLSLGEFQGAVAAGSGAKPVSAVIAGLANADAEDKIIREQIAVAKFKEGLASDAAKPPAGATVNGGSGAKAGGGKASKGAQQKQQPAAPASAGAASASPAAAPITSVDQLPTACDLEADVKTPTGQARLLQAYALQLYEIARLKGENEGLKSTVSSLESKLKEASTVQKAALLEELAQARGQVSEFGVEVARLHMDDQKSRSRIHELETALKQLLQAQQAHAHAAAANATSMHTQMQLMHAAAGHGHGSHGRGGQGPVVAPPPGFGAAVGAATSGGPGTGDGAPVAGAYLPPHKR